MALDSALVMKLTDSMRDFALELRTLNKNVEAQTVALAQMAEAQKKTTEACEAMAAALGEWLEAQGDAPAGDDDEGEELEDDDGGDGDEEVTEAGAVPDGDALAKLLPSWIPEPLRKEALKKKDDPAFWLGLLNKVREASAGANGHAKKDG